MVQNKHKVFISYHHANDQAYKEALFELNDTYDLFSDASVDTGDVDDNLDDDAIRQKIRDEYLKDSTVTIVLVGLETKKRKHVDWEIYSSMFDGTRNKRSGVLAVTLPDTGCTSFTAPHDQEKEVIYPYNTSWMSIDERGEYEKRYPHMPDRIIDNLLRPSAKVSVTNWDKIADDPEKLRFLIEAAHRDRSGCDYDLSH